VCYFENKIVEVNIMKKKTTGEKDLALSGHMAYYY
jgi:hypothetical protein